MRLLIRQGAWAAFPNLEEMPRRWPDLVGLDGKRACGARALEQVLRDALADWHRESPRDAAAMDRLLGLGHHGRRVLNGPHGLRTSAGRLFGDVGWDQFSRQYEGPLVERFVDFLQRWDGRQGPAAPMTSLGFADVECTAVSLHRRLEREFRPDLVITMSGPGSIAACYMMRLDPRDVPVLVAVTFPRREHVSAAETEFAAAARAADTVHLRTSKWSIYLPEVVRHLPRGHRIALVDDRVMTGESQRLVRQTLTDLGYRVTCAALFANPGVAGPDVMIGREIAGPFQMPWGPADGRD